MKILQAFLIISVALIYGCSDSFTREVDLDDQPFDPQLYVNVNYVLGDPHINVSVAPLIDINDDYFSNGKGWYYEYDENGNIIDSFFTDISISNHSLPYKFTLTDQSGTIIYNNGCDKNCYYSAFQIDSNLIKPNQNYTLTLESPNYPTITGTAIIYDGPDFSLKSLNSQNGVEANLTFEIEDDPNHENYYNIRGYYGECYEGECWKNDIYWDFAGDQLTDVRIGYYHNYLPDDVFVNNKKIARYSAQFSFLHFGSDTSTVYFELFNYDKKQFDYDVRLNGIYEAEYNPFIEPASLISNIEGGVGNFTIASRKTLTFSEEEIKNMIEN